MSQEHPLRIGFLLHDVSRLRRTAADKYLKPLGLTRSQSWLLGYLHRHKGVGKTQSELSKEMEVGKVTLCRLVDRLEENGFVERRSDDSDRRVHRIYMTKKGAALVSAMREVSAELNAEILEDISDEDVAKVEEVLSKMKIKLITMTS